MKKFQIIFLLLVTSYLLLVTFTSPVHAAPCTDPTDWHCVIGGVTDPTGVPGANGDEQLSNFISTIIRLIFIVAGIVFAFMIIFGAFQWMTSSGEKEALAKARGRITHAIIGLVLLSLAFVIINILGNITGIGILGNNKFKNPNLPTDQQKPGINNPLLPNGQNDTNGINNPVIPNNNQRPGINAPVLPNGQNDTNGFTNPVVPNDQSGTSGFNSGNTGGGNSNPCCPPASRRQNNKCIDIGTNLAVPELNPSACR